MDNLSQANRPISQLLPEFHQQYNLGEDGGINESKVKIEFSKYVYFFFPNWDDRRRAVEKHDIHHIVTGYPSTVKGEAEISIWEVSSGCTNFWAAWFLDMQGMMLGLVYPTAIFNAFVRGQRSGNLYHTTLTNAEAKKLTPAEVREKLNIPDIDEKLQPTVAEYFLFAWYMAWAGLVSLLSLVAVPVIVLFNIYVFAGLILATKKKASA
jgi:hypothetical protein